MVITKNWFVIHGTEPDGTVLFFQPETGEWKALSPGCLIESARYAYEMAALFDGTVSMVTLTLRPTPERTT